MDALCALLDCALGFFPCYFLFGCNRHIVKGANYQEGSHLKIQRSAVHCMWILCCHTEMSRNVSCGRYLLKETGMSLCGRALTFVQLKGSFFATLQKVESGAGRLARFGSSALAMCVPSVVFCSSSCLCLPANYPVSL